MAVDEAILNEGTEEGPGAPAGSAPSAFKHLDDDELVARVRAGGVSSFAGLMRRYNQKLFRAIRSILRDADAIEDTMQDTYLAAFRHLDQFEGRSQFGTWLLRIGINEALARRRHPNREIAFEGLPEEVSSTMEQDGTIRTPEQQASRRELVDTLEAAIDRLPDGYRQVFMLRMVDAMDSAETATVLGLSEGTVRQRLHRARKMIQDDLQCRADLAVHTAFGFLGDRCDRLVARVMQQLVVERGARGEPPAPREA